ncbi:MAG: hypothetical protein WB760_28990 [Xanthobacteraceae bacterium]
MPPADADFSFRIEFAKGEGNPRRVFDAASQLIDGFEELDGAVAGSVDSRLRTLMVLEDIEAGSIKVFLKTILENIDDQALKDGEYRRAIGPALVRAKYAAIEFLNQEKGAATAQVDTLRETLQNIARETDARHLPDYPPIHEAKLVASLDTIQDAKRALSPQDKLTIETEDRTYEVDLSKTWEPSEVVQTPAEPTSERDSEAEIILTIRRPDMLGDSMWQFGHGNQRISARVLDENWLERFHRGSIAIRSGDALRCRVKFIYTFDSNGTLVEQKTDILEVLELLGGGSGEQLHMFPG